MMKISAREVKELVKNVLIAASSCGYDVFTSYIQSVNLYLKICLPCEWGLKKFAAHNA